MGTRSLTRTWDFWKDEAGKEHKSRLMTMYRQMDGYPEGHGLELANFLVDMYITNGISLAEKRKIANGMSCLSAQIVAYFKEGPGGIYLMATPSGHWEEYIYDIYPDGDRTKIVMTTCGKPKVVESFTPEEFILKYSKKEA